MTPTPETLRALADDMLDGMDPTDQQEADRKALRAHARKWQAEQKQATADKARIEELEKDRDWALRELRLHGVDTDPDHRAALKEVKPATITDGYQTWPKRCAMCGEDTMSVVRIGKVQCSECG